LYTFYIFLLPKLFYILLYHILANIACKLMLPYDLFISMIPWDHPVPLRGVRILYWYSQIFYIAWQQLTLLTGSCKY